MHEKYDKILQDNQFLDEMIDFYADKQALDTGVQQLQGDLQQDVDYEPKFEQKVQLNRVTEEDEEDIKQSIDNVLSSELIAGSNDVGV